MNEKGGTIAVEYCIRVSFRYPQVIFEEIIPQIIPIGGDFMLNYAEICDMKTLKNVEKSRGFGMIKVLFVCHGNICRSPMAEFVMKDMVQRRGIGERFHIESRATHTDEIWGGKGNPVYPPAREKLAEHGISCKGKTAQLLTKKDYTDYDYIIGMDRENMRWIERMLGGDSEGKVSMLMDYTKRPGSVADPWYTGDFDATWRDVEEGCRGLLDHLTEQGI